MALNGLQGITITGTLAALGVAVFLLPDSVLLPAAGSVNPPPVQAKQANVEPFEHPEWSSLGDRLAAVRMDPEPPPPIPRPPFDNPDEGEEETPDEPISRLPRLEWRYVGMFEQPNMNVAWIVMGERQVAAAPGDVIRDQTIISGGAVTIVSVSPDEVVVEREDETRQSIERTARADTPRSPN